MSAHMNTLWFEKISKFDRTEPIALGVPFAMGELEDPQAFRLKDGSRCIPCQVSVTGKWSDGSVKWLFVRAIVDLPGNKGKELRFDSNGSQNAPDSAVQVSVEHADDGSLRVNTGPLTATVPTQGIWPLKDVALNGKVICEGELFQGLKMQFGEIAHRSSDLSVKLSVEESGPLRAVIRMDAEKPEDRRQPAVRGRLTFWAGMPYVIFRYTVTNLNEDVGEFIEVRDWTLDLTPVGEHPTLRVAQGCYLDNITRNDEGQEEVAFRFTKDFLLAAGFEHTPDSFAYNSWADWESTQGGVMVSVKHAAQNFPKGYVAAPDRLTAELYPASEEEPLEWFAGSAKTHEMMFHFHEAGTTDEDLSARSLQFQIPDVPVLSKERYGQAEVWPERIFDGPESRKVINRLITIADSRPIGLGVFNFGDEWDAGYTNQGRGFKGKDEGDRLVWLNNEYDVTHHFFLLSARTGLRRLADYAINSAQHWMDVDINHSSTDPAKRNGHIAHIRRHAAWAATYPSHQWVQGLFDTYHFTGDPDAMEAAVGVAENIAWQIEHRGFLKPGNSQTREMGWALRAMLNAWRETHDQKYFSLGERIVELFSNWGKSGEMLAPYTSHSEVRVAFMNALTAVSLALWHLETGCEVAKRIAVEVADDLIENATLPWGLPYYKELPSLKLAVANLIPVELYSYVYRITGEKKYLEAGLVPLEASLGSAAGSKVQVKRTMTNGLYFASTSPGQGGKGFAMSLNPILQFISVSGSEKLAKQLDYKLEL